MPFPSQMDNSDVDYVVNEEYFDAIESPRQ